MNPAKLIAALTKYGGPARANQYQIFLPRIQGAPISPLDLDLLCRSCRLPGRTINVLEQKTSYKPREVAGGGALESVTLTFTEVGTGLVYAYFQAWLDLVQDRDTGLTGYDSQVAKPVTIWRLNKAGKPVSRYELEGCWPKSLPEVEFTDTGQNEVQTVSVGLAVKNFRTVGLNEGANGR